MFGFIARFVGLWLWAGAVVAAVYDGTKSLAVSEFVWTPLGQTWYALHPQSLNGLQVVIERHFAEFLFTSLGAWAAEIAYFLWDPLTQSLLLAPTWSVLGVLGLFFLWVGRKKMPHSRIAAQHA
jgi:hypothetical protein